MISNNQELEVKFYISNLSILETRLKEIGARLLQPRMFEANLRFDTPQEDLKQSFRVLRLRQDTEARLTYKGPAQDEGGARLRQEIEFTVGDFRAARAFLEGLGYQVSMAYEKYRTTYELESLHILLDEMPYGNFAEIEGLDAASIQSASQRLGLDWAARVAESYTALFDQLRVRLGLTFRDLTFDNFKSLEVSPEVLNVYPADKR